MIKKIKEIFIEEPKSTRDGYGQALLELGKNKNIVALSADLTESTRAIYFQKKYPERFFQCGVAEQNMISL
ncbi:MAG TPA: transketolase family protein, partial [Candidatus Parcubacteria bacterium]|nr:transketolase family protein [Candidatus Parcubacteria bacterium]